MKYNLILGSQSPRRSELLKQTGLKFETISLNVDETYPDHLSPELIPEYLSNKKSDAYNIENDTDLLITADTVVILNQQILEKPKSKDDAIRMLKLLSNNSHKVITGVTLRTINTRKSFSEVTEVSFKKLSSFEIEYYIDNYEPYDKAGSYGIQEWIGLIGVNSINGSYFNVVGLPIHSVYNSIMAFQK